MLRRVMGKILLALIFAAPLLASGNLLAADNDTEAQRQVNQPGNNAPVWREVRSGEPQFTTTRGVETGVLVQPGKPLSAGEAWRRLHNGPVTQIGGWFLVAVMLG